MAQVINFPLDIRYRVYGINRDGRIIVDIINSKKRFIMHAEQIVATAQLINKFSKKQVQWLCDIVDSNNGCYQSQTSR